jgi:hypothetical protein
LQKVTVKEGGVDVTRARRTRERPPGIKWGAVALGWVVAVVAGIVINFILRILFRFFVEFPPDPTELTVGVIVVSLLSGFLAYLVGGYAAGRSARVSGGLNGAMTAVFGLILGVILAVIFLFFDLVLTGAVALPPVSFGMAGIALIAGLVLFLVNLLAGYVGGKLGEPS